MGKKTILKSALFFMVLAIVYTGHRIAQDYSLHRDRLKRFSAPGKKITQRARVDRVALDQNVLTKGMIGEEVEIQRSFGTGLSEQHEYIKFKNAKLRKKSLIKIYFKKLKELDSESLPEIFLLTDAIVEHFDIYSDGVRKLLETNPTLYKGEENEHYWINFSIVKTYAIKQLTKKMAQNEVYPQDVQLLLPSLKKIVRQDPNLYIVRESMLALLEMGVESERLKELVKRRPINENFAYSDLLQHPSNY